MHIKNLKSKIFISAAILAGVTTPGCKMVTEDLDPCPAQLRIRFVYDYNLKWGDAFPHEVTSVNVWAFNPDGGLAWSGAAAGAELKEDGFYLETPLKEGNYDFVAWCGLEGNPDFDLATYKPASKEELEVTMRTVDEDGLHVSNAHLPGLYHAEQENVKYEVDPYNPTFSNVKMELMKDTKDIRVMLQHYDGSAIEMRDFEVKITDKNGEYAWNNDLLPSSPLVTYKPWNTKYGQTTPPGEKEKTRTLYDMAQTRTQSTVASLLFELSTGRLMADSEARLVVHRKWDDRTIIDIPLIQYFLLVKGHYGDISDQEYLDRQDDYSIVFFIDKHSTWYVAGGIFVNNWAVVPPQEPEL